LSEYPGVGTVRPVDRPGWTQRLCSGRLICGEPGHASV